MISNKWSKIIKSLQIKKFRHEHGYFLVEGVKSIQELVHSDFDCVYWAMSEQCSSQYFFDEPNNWPECQITSEADINNHSAMVSNDTVLAVVRIPESLPAKFPTTGWSIVLDGVKDPGNLGTIIRIADWFGIEQIVCSKDTTDVFAPKVIQATMGSFIRVGVLYEDIYSYIYEAKKLNISCFAATMSGSSAYAIDWPSNGVLVMGSESHGVSCEIENLVDKQISIPRVGGAESLNVAVATAILCSHISARR